MPETTPVQNEFPNAPVVQPKAVADWLNDLAGKFERCEN